MSMSLLQAAPMTLGLVLAAGMALGGPLSAPPDRRPERVLLTFSGDPSTEIATTWRRPADITPNPEHQPVAQLTEAQPGPHLAKGNVRSFPAQTERLEGVQSRHTSETMVTYEYYTAKMTGLTPSTKYAYRVGNGKEWSEWNHFTTAQSGAGATVPGKFRFLYLGDAQNDILSLWSRVMRDAILRVPDARFSLHAGDLIDMGNDDQEWNEWFEGGGWINRVIPVIAVPGNHEYPRVKAGEPKRNLSKLWKPQFEYPTNGAPGLADTTYHVDYEGVRIIGLDTNADLDSQTTWLETVLANNPNRWTVLTFHHPVYSTAAKRDNPKIRAAWMPLIDKYAVDLVLQGHDHTYGRTYPLKAGTQVGLANPGGTVYAVSVSGPKMYEISTSTQQLMERRAEDTQFYQVISVENDKLEYESYTAGGQLYDAFTLTKTPKGNRFATRKDLPAELLRKTKVADDGE
jgi:hypothetical protein